MLKDIAQSLIQDAATAGAGWLTAHGFLSSDQTQGFVGAIFFLGMLAFNAYMQHSQTKDRTP